MRLLTLNKKEIVTSIFIILCLAGYVFFPATGTFQHKLVMLIFLVLLPFLYCRYFLKEKNIFSRFSVGDWKNNLISLIIALIGSFFIIYLLFEYTELLSHYFLPLGIKNNFSLFLIYEFTGVAFTVILYELFFRGFIMFYFKSFTGKWSVLIQVLFFILMITLFNLPYWFYITYLIFAPIAGWLAYKSESLLYSYFGQLFFIIIVDAYYIAVTVK